MNYVLHGLFNNISLEYFEKHFIKKILFMELTNNFFKTARIGLFFCCFYLKKSFVKRILFVALVNNK